MVWIRGCGTFTRMAFMLMHSLPLAIDCGGIGVTIHSDGMAILIIMIIGDGRLAGSAGGGPITIGMQGRIGRIGIMGRAIGDVPLTIPSLLVGRMALGPCREVEHPLRAEWLRALRGNRFVEPVQEVQVCAAVRLRVCDVVRPAL